MDRWDDTTEAILDRIWSVLDGDAPRAVLATLGQGGGPEARMVVLRRAHRAAGKIDVHTDRDTPKVAELTAEPRAALHLWMESLRLQIRLRGAVTIRHGAEVASTWDALPQQSRTNYGVEPAPGTPIASAHGYERKPQRARLAVLTLRVAEIDAVVLAEDFHRRAIFSRADGWHGQWVAP